MDEIDVRCAYMAVQPMHGGYRGRFRVAARNEAPGAAHALVPTKLEKSFERDAARREPWREDVKGRIAQACVILSRDDSLTATSRLHVRGLPRARTRE